MTRRLLALVAVSLFASVALWIGLQPHDGRHAGLSGGPPFAVIPSTVFVAPLAVLAALFPATFAGLASGFRRWRAFLVVVSVNGTLAAVYFFTRKYLPDAWWASPVAFTALLLGVVAVGLVWSGRRYRLAAIDPAVTDPPTRRDILAVLGFAAASVGLVLVVAAVTNWVTAGSPFMRFAELMKLLFELPTRELTAAIVGLLAAAIYLTYRMRTSPIDPPQSIRLSTPGESVALGAMLLFGTISLVNAIPRAAVATATIEGGDTAVTPAEAKLKLIDAGVWYEATDVEEAYSGLAFSNDAAYFGGVKDSLFRKGAIVCLNRATGKQRWVYADRELKAVYCTPTEANGRVFCGEGLHTDPACRMLGLDAATGTKVWDTRTTSHTEGTPVVADGKVYFSAGDDGLYCLTADGGEVWRCRGREQRLHVDTPVAVANGRVYAGSGYQTLVAFCLNADSGEQVWRTEFSLRSFGPPLVIGRRVYYGLGTGNLSFDLSTEPEPGRPPEVAPGGAVVCLDAATGEQVWKHDLTHSVHTQLSADGRALYAACRDGWVYALDLANGKRLWRFNYGVPLSTGTATAAYTRFGFPVAVYVATPDGRVSAHDPATGKVFWSRSIPEIAGRDAEVMAAPTVLKADTDGNERQVYVTVTLTNRNNGVKAAAVVRFVDRAVDRD